MVVIDILKLSQCFSWSFSFVSLKLEYHYTLMHWDLWFKTSLVLVHLVSLLFTLTLLI